MASELQTWVHRSSPYPSGERKERTTLPREMFSGVTLGRRRGDPWFL